MKKVLLVITCVWLTANADGSLGSAQIASQLKNGNPISCAPGLKCSSPLLTKFYQNRRNKLAWVKDNGLTPAGKALVTAISQANVDGLDPRRYHVKQINNLLAELNDNTENRSSVLTSLDITLSDGLLLYLDNLVYGLNNSKRLYPGWPSAIKQVNLIDIATDATQTNNIDQVLINAGPKYPGYSGLRGKLADYYKVANNGGWKNIPGGEDLKKGAIGERVSLLQQRLYISGELLGVSHQGEFDDDLEKAVIKYQQNNGLADTGVVDKDTLKSLNIPVGTRIRQIELNMDRMRFLPDAYPERYVLVNVPDYSLVAMENKKITLFSDLVVGKPNKRTCILNSTITTIEINPYWNVPVSIVKEILPDIKANPSYLADNGIKVFKVESNGQYVEVDPKTINWKNPDGDILSLRFREDPGEDNALGRFKFIFANNCGIYLHDSLAQSAFEASNRGLSHGCIRVAEVDDFARYLLATKEGWGRQRLEQELASGKNKFVKLAKPMPLYIIYLTAWYDRDEDFVQFRDDIYHFDKLKLYPLYLNEEN